MAEEELEKKLRELRNKIQNMEEEAPASSEKEAVEGRQGSVEIIKELKPDEAIEVKEEKKRFQFPTLRRKKQNRKWYKKRLLRTNLPYR